MVHPERKKAQAFNHVTMIQILTGRGVQCDYISPLIIDTFQDINFSLIKMP